MIMKNLHFIFNLSFMFYISTTKIKKQPTRWRRRWRRDRLYAETGTWQLVEFKSMKDGSEKLITSSSAPIMKWADSLIPPTDPAACCEQREADQSATMVVKLSRGKTSTTNPLWQRRAEAAHQLVFVCLCCINIFNQPYFLHCWRHY